jgi:hypothetical protein
LSTTASEECTSTGRNSDELLPDPTSYVKRGIATVNTGTFFLPLTGSGVSLLDPNPKKIFQIHNPRIPESTTLFRITGNYIGNNFKHR